MKKTFFLPFLLSFIIGLITPGYFPLFKITPALVQIFYFIPLLISLLILRKNFFFFYALFFLLGINIWQHHYKDITACPSFQDISITCVVSKYKTTPHGVSIYGNVIQQSADPFLEGQKVYFYLHGTKNTELEEGDILFCRNIDLIPVKASGLSYKFDFDHLLYQKGVFYKSFIQDSLSIIKWGNLPSIEGYFGKVNVKWQSIFSTNLVDQRVSSILSALSLGDKSQLDEKTKHVFASTGSMHVLAVSGLHVGIIYMIVRNILILLCAGIPHKNVIVWIACLVAVWCFAGITGSSPATIRAVLMLCIFTTGQLFQQKPMILHTIAIVAFIQLCIEPDLINSLSFQFSFIALSSIIIFQPLLQSVYLPDQKIMRYLFQLIYLAFAAQILSLPLNLYYFKQFPIYFFVSGLIAVPFAVILLSMAMLLISSSLLFTWLPEILLFIVTHTTLLFYKILEWISTLPYSTIPCIEFNISDFLCYYSLVLVITQFFIGNKKRKLFFIGIAILIVWLCTSTLREWDKNTQQIFIKRTIAKTEYYCKIDGRTCLASCTDNVSQLKWEEELQEIQTYYGIYHTVQTNQENFRSVIQGFYRDSVLKKDTIIRSGILERLHFSKI